MNFLVVMVTFGCTVFLFRFLVALEREQKKKPRPLRAYWLDHSLKKSTSTPPDRIKLRVVPPQEFAVRHFLSLAELNITQQKLMRRL